MFNKVFLIEVNPERLLINLKVDKHYVEIINKSQDGDLLGDSYGYHKCIKITKDNNLVVYHIPITEFGSDALDKQILDITLSLSDLSKRLFTKLLDKIPENQPFIFMTGADKTGSLCTLNCLINKDYIYKLSKITEEEKKEITDAMDYVYWRIFNKPITSNNNYIYTKFTKDTGLLDFTLKTSTPLCKNGGPFTLNGSGQVHNKINMHLNTEASVCTCSMDAQMILLVGMIALNNILSKNNY